MRSVPVNFMRDAWRRLRRYRRNGNGLSFEDNYRFIKFAIRG